MLVPDHDPDCGMILVMGVTGSGKSYFINKLVEGSVAEGSGLRSGKDDSLILAETAHLFR
jgi:predicted GTPase